MIGMGALKRKEPTGDFAKGIPSQRSVPFTADDSPTKPPEVRRTSKLLLVSALARTDNVAVAARHTARRLDATIAASCTPQNSLQVYIPSVTALTLLLRWIPSCEMTVSRMLSEAGKSHGQRENKAPSRVVVRSVMRYERLSVRR